MVAKKRPVGSKKKRRVHKTKRKRRNSRAKYWGRKKEKVPNTSPFNLLGEPGKGGEGGEKGRGVCFRRRTEGGETKRKAAKNKTDFPVILGKEGGKEKRGEGDCPRG